MSRAFLKDDTSGDQPIIPPRPALPAGSPNYVTPTGLEQLRTEMAELEAERTIAEANRDNDADRAWQLTILNGKMAALKQRIATAKVIDPAAQPAGEVRFGATVTLVTRKGGKVGFTRKFTIVGVDEANIAEGKIAFAAPIARVVQGAKTGDVLTVKLGPAAEEVEVTKIEY